MMAEDWKKFLEEMSEEEFLAMVNGKEMVKARCSYFVCMIYRGMTKKCIL